MREFMEVCERAARAGGKVLLDWQDRITATEKAPRDLVTEADLASQEAIRKLLLGAFPDHGFLGEEDALGARKSGQQEILTAPQTEYRWIVDPLDGTVNYVHRLQNFAVSIALERRGEILVSTVFDPVMNECFTAMAGEGASVNGQRLQTSNCSHLNNALAAVSFSSNVPRGSSEISRFVEVLHACRSLRRLGSAALNLCYLAAGRLDAYWATSVHAWDIAAGVLTVREAGGIVTAIDGSPLDLARPHFAASATPQLHEELLHVLARGSS